LADVTKGGKTARSIRDPNKGKTRLRGGLAKGGTGVAASSLIDVWGG